MRQGTQLFAFIGYKKTEKTGGKLQFQKYISTLYCFSKDIITC